MGLRMPELFTSSRRGRGGGSIPSKTDATLQPHTNSPEITKRNRTQRVQSKNATPCTDATPPTGCTLKEYAAAKNLPMSFLQKLGISDVSYLGSPAIRIPYLDQAKEEIGIQFRLTMSGDDRFRWRKGSKPGLYGQWRLNHDKPRESVVLCEGESDCHTLWFHEIPALGLPGATNWCEDRDAPFLEGINTIYVLVEPDKGGEAVKKWLASSIIRDRAKLVDLGEYKDPSGLYLDAPKKFKSRWEQILTDAVPWCEIELKQRESEEREAWAKSKTLAQLSSILTRFAEELEGCGVVGEIRAAKLLYLAVTSRFFARPISAATRGPSSVGKSFVVERVLEFFPSRAYYALSGMSEKALAYSEEPLSHRFLVLYEAAGFGSDFATYLVRSLLSEGRIRYETIEKTKEGLKPRLIVRQGPTGLIVTTTAVKLHPENETRILSIPLADTTEQTHRILLALADDQTSGIDFTPWHALQTWLETGEHEVVIPYARALANLIPPVAVRLRRDFSAILNFIKAHALLHRATRERDSEGRIKATFEDYSVVRELVADLVAEGVEATVPATVGETVITVKNLLEESSKDSPIATVAQVATRLQLDKSAAYRRVQTAISRGYLANLETRKGRPAKLILGDPLPDDVQILPSPEALKNSQGCRVASQTEGICIPPSPPWGESSDFREVEI
jgi:hypothetical protein